MITAERTLECFAKTHVNVPDELTIADDAWQNRLEDDQSVFRVITPKDGDKRVVWSRGSIPQINAAKKMFNDLVAAGMVPFKVGTGGKASSDVMNVFDPSAEEVIFLPTKVITAG
jgi:hypothetical protein